VVSAVRFTPNKKESCFMKLITEEWLSRAKDDLDVAKEILEMEHLTNMVAFHSQQAMEKTLKALKAKSPALLFGQIALSQFLSGN
jgi:hypothetical protein